MILLAEYTFKTVGFFRMYASEFEKYKENIGFQCIYCLIELQYVCLKTRGKTVS